MSLIRNASPAMNQRIVLIRHNDGPEDDRVATFLTLAGVAFETRKPFKGETLGEVDDAVVGTVIYGGPFVVTETDAHPFLMDEARWIETCMRRNLPVLGICQGAQAVAHLLGAEVGPLPGEPHEFGYYPIYRSADAGTLFPEVIHVTQSHWHGFDLPPGAELLATSDLFPHQAFRYGDKTFGFQFHAEVTIRGFQRWQVSDRAHYGKPGAQSKPEQDALAAEYDAAQHQWFMGFLENLFDQVTESNERPEFLANA